MIGGLLARPAERFPNLFGQNSFLKEYPYFLPCAIPATLTIIAWLVTFLFLKETLPAPISVGQLLNITTERNKPISQNNIGPTDLSAATIPGQNTNINDHSQAEGPLSLRSLLTPRVLIASGNYATISLVDIAFRAIQPVFLSTPIHLGGLGLSTPSIGILLSIAGVLNGVFQGLFFAQIHDYWGSKNTFVVGVASAIPTFILFPVSNTLARAQGYSTAVWITIGLQCIPGIFFSLSYCQQCS